MSLELNRRVNFKCTILCVMLAMMSITCSDQDDRMAYLIVKEFPGRIQDFSLWQLEQFYGDSQMAYIIKTDDKQVIVIDGGRSRAAHLLEDYLTQLGGVVDTWIITHPHVDHIGAIQEIINRKKITINRILHTKIDEDLVRLHEPISNELVHTFYQILGNSKIPVMDVAKGENISLGEGVDLQVLGVKNPNILVNLVNNSSLTFKISSETKSILFLGDLGVEGGNEILKTAVPGELQADYVQMAHHGQDGVSKEFYSAVNAHSALWPTPSWLWENNIDAKGYNTGAWKTLTVRQWMEELNIKRNYVSGLEGTTQID